MFCSALCPLTNLGLYVKRHLMYYIYFARMIEAPNWGIKIGRAKDPKRRLVELQQFLPRQLECLGTLSEDSIALTEGNIHMMFSSDRFHGEWFRPSQRLLAYIKEHKTGRSFKVPYPRHGKDWGTQPPPHRE